MQTIKIILGIIMLLILIPAIIGIANKQMEDNFWDGFIEGCKILSCVIFVVFWIMIAVNLIFQLLI